jgi:hypothetical protein
VISYCESLRVECRPFGVKDVTLRPGNIDTPLTRDNRYPMPFLMSPAAFAERAVDAIEQGASYRVIPWQMGIVAGFLRVLPSLARPGTGGAAPKASKTQEHRLKETAAL